MRIALCLSGLSKFLDVGYVQIYENILSKFDEVDVFVHTWWSDNMIGLVDNRGYTYPYDTIEKINNLYSPKKLFYEPQKEFNIKNDVSYGLQNPISPYSMYYSIKRSNELKKEYEDYFNFKYDIVIRCRFDIVFKKNLDFNFEKVSNNCVYLDKVLSSLTCSGFPNDQFCISDSLTSDVYSSLYDKLNFYYDLGFREFIGERLLKYHLEQNSIKIEFKDEIKNGCYLA